MVNKGFLNNNTIINALIGFLLLVWTHIIMCVHNIVLNLFQEWFYNFFFSYIQNTNTHLSLQLLPFFFERSYCVNDLSFALHIQLYIQMQINKQKKIFFFNHSKAYFYINMKVSYTLSLQWNRITIEKVEKL